MAALAVSLAASGPALAQVESQTAPSVPRNIQATGGDDGVVLSWEAPSSWGSWQAAGIGMQWRPAGGTSWNWAAQEEWDYFDPTLTSAAWRTNPPGVARSGTSFQFRLYAWAQDPAVFGQPATSQNNVNGPFSEPVSATLQPSASAPPPVSGLVASWIGATSRIQITWDAPSSGLISRYNVSVNTNADNPVQAQPGTFGWVGLGYSDRMVRPRLVFGPNYGAANQFSLNRNTDYWVRVQQRNSRGNSPYVRVKVVDEPPAPPAPPAPLAATVALSLTANPVPEGAEVGIRVAMSPFVPRNLAIPVVVTAADGGSGLADVSPDRPRRATIHINGAAYGHNQGVLWLHAIRDGDAHDETYTVAIDTDNLPEQVTVAPPASITLTIEDSDTTESLALVQDIAERDRLIADQENLLNAYRCQFGTDTGLVPGGCDAADPARTTTPAAPPPNPTPQHLDARDQLSAAQEALLNAYRCQHGIDTHLVPEGCTEQS